MFVMRQPRGTHGSTHRERRAHIETKGREDIDVAHKDRAAHIWSENATLLTGVAWRYMKVPQADFTKLQATELSEIALILGSAEAPSP